MTFCGPSLSAPVDVVGLLDQVVASLPDDLAVVSASERLSWRQLDDASRRLAANLLALGLSQGDRVASLMPNVPTLVVFYIACVRAGVVATPLNYRYTPTEIDYALRVSQASALVVHADRVADVDHSLEVGRLPVGVLWFGDPASTSTSLEQLIAEEPESALLPAVDRSHPAFVFFTSGSTGSPKGVTHSFDSIGWIAASTSKLLEYRRGDRFIVGSSLSHEGGVGFSFAAISAGVPLIIPPTMAPDEVLPMLREHRPTVMWTLPALLITLVRSDNATADDFDSVRMCMTGGDQTPDQLEREFESLAGFAIHQSYGTTESGDVATNPRHGLDKRGSIGNLTPGYEGSLRDDDGNEVAPGTEGRLWIRSETNMIGYWNDDEATADVRDCDGFLDSGDVMTLDEDGYLWFRGRKKQIIVHDGSNISPQEVEGVLLEHPAVAAAGVVGIVDADHGENVCAYVVLRDPLSRPSDRELIDFARERVGYKAPAEIVVIDSLPRDRSCRRMSRAESDLT